MLERLIDWFSHLIDCTIITMQQCLKKESLQTAIEK